MNGLLVTAAIAGVVLVVTLLWRRPPLRTATGWVVPSLLLYGYLAAGLAAVPLTLLVVVMLGPGFFGSGLGGLRLIEYAVYLTGLSVVAFVLYHLGYLVIRRPAAAAALALLLHAPLSFAAAPIVLDGQISSGGARDGRVVDPADFRVDLRRVDAQRDAGGRLLALALVVDVDNVAVAPAHIRSWRIHGLPGPSQQVVEDVLKAGQTLGPPLRSPGEPVLLEPGTTRLTFMIEPSLIGRLEVPDGRYTLVIDVGAELVVAFDVTTR